MRFGAARAVEQVRVFSFDRRAGSEGEGRAADLARAAFERAGFRVRCAELTGSPVIEALRLGTARVGSAAGFAAPVVAAAAGAWTLALAAVSVALGVAWPWLVAGAFGPIRNKGWRRPRPGPRLVAADRPGRAEAPVRVVFVTALDLPRRVLTGPPARVARRVKNGFTLAVVSLGLAFGAVPSGPRPALLLGLVAAYLVAVVVDFLAHLGPGTRPGDTGHHDGLATLIELARSWPVGRDERIEVHFEAVTGRFFDRAGLKSLNDRIGHDWPPKPTLVVGLWSPGLGPPFDLATNSLEGYDVMQSAAEDLWIPHQDADGRDLWPFGTGDPDFVAVVGASGRATVTPESLTLVAQLVTEVALRWARRMATAQEPDPSRARSSQNPG